MRAQTQQVLIAGGDNLTLAGDGTGKNHIIVRISNDHWFDLFRVDDRCQRGVAYDQFAETLASFRRGKSFAAQDIFQLFKQCRAGEQFEDAVANVQHAARLPRHNKPETTIFVSATTRIEYMPRLPRRGYFRFDFRFAERLLQVGQPVGGGK